MPTFFSIGLVYSLQETTEVFRDICLLVIAYTETAQSINLQSKTTWLKQKNS